MRIGRAVKDYRAAYPEPLVVSKGERVTIIPKESEWAGWVWCVDKNGIGGWVPEKYLEIKDDKGIFRRDYSAKELSVTAGEELKIIEEEGGWGWCENGKGGQGWAPLENMVLRGRTDAR
jgi:uncharacterized protein YgiM (DUF1202 family)